MNSSQKIAFIGAGSMCEALISGMLKERLYLPGHINVINRSNVDRLQSLKTKYLVNITDNKEEIVKGSDIIVLAVKPKDVTEAIAGIAPFINKNQVLISVLAGISTDKILALLQKNIPIIRAMPNTSAHIGKSATALSVGKYANEHHLALAKSLFTTVGIVTVVSEEQLHAVTGLSGSGPAYVYYLVESMERAANEIGLKEEVAKELILQTIIGAAEMLKSSSKTPVLLRKEVTSPGGTTEAGLQVLENFNYQEAMVACIRRATERSIQLGEM
jgi:pyrroline-5-carboxylate reductase